MLQSMAIKLISSKAQDSDLVDAIYLSGALACDLGDSSSDIHLHLVVEASKYNQVYSLREDFLEAYYSIMHISFDGDTRITKCVYDNGIVVYLYIVTYNEIKELSNIKIICDFRDFLKNKIPPKSYLSSTLLGEKINDFSFLLVKFHQYVNADKKIDMLKTSLELYEVLIKYLNLRFSNEELEENIGINLEKIFSNFRITSSIDNVKNMLLIIDRYMQNITIDMAQIVNMDLYSYAKKKILTL